VFWVAKQSTDSSFLSLGAIGGATKTCFRISAVQFLSLKSPYIASICGDFVIFFPAAPPIASGCSKDRSGTPLKAALSQPYRQLTVGPRGSVTGHPKLVESAQGYEARASAVTGDV